MVLTVVIGTLVDIVVVVRVVVVRFVTVEVDVVRCLRLGKTFHTSQMSYLLL